MTHHRLSFLPACCSLLLVVPCLAPAVRAQHPPLAPTTDTVIVVPPGPLYYSST
jgi:hypothetical protein